MNDDFDDGHWVHFSPYQYVVRLGNELGPSLERDGRGGDNWIATHISDVLSGFASTIRTRRRSL